MNNILWLNFIMLVYHVSGSDNISIKEIISRILIYWLFMIFIISLPLIHAVIVCLIPGLSGTDPSQVSLTVIHSGQYCKCLRGFPYTVDGFIFVGFQFSWLLWRVQSSNSSTHELAIFCMIYEGKYYGHEFWTLRICHFFVTTKIGTHENKGIHSIFSLLSAAKFWISPWELLCKANCVLQVTYMLL